jgi:hypothetical protein
VLVGREAQAQGEPDSDLKQWEQKVEIPRLGFGFGSKKVGRRECNTGMELHM